MTSDRAWKAIIAAEREPLSVDPQPFELSEIVEELRPPRKKRRYSLKRAITDARKMGVDVKVEPDGAITLKCSQPSTASTGNAWDVVLQ
jgi:hypothetical protein